MAGETYPERSRNLCISSEKSAEVIVGEDATEVTVLNERYVCEARANSVVELPDKEVTHQRTER
jgi:hypothetical protein